MRNLGELFLLYQDYQEHFQRKIDEKIFHENKSEKSVQQ